MARFSVIKIMGGLVVAAGVTLGATACDGTSGSGVNIHTMSYDAFLQLPISKQLAVTKSEMRRWHMKTDAADVNQEADTTMSVAAFNAFGCSVDGVFAQMAEPASTEGVADVDGTMEYPHLDNSSEAEQLQATCGAKSSDSANTAAAAPAPTPAPAAADGGASTPAVPDPAPAPAPTSSAAPVPAPTPSTSNSDGIVQNTQNAPAAIVSTLSNYFGMINDSQYAGAYKQFGPQEEATQTESQFAANMATTQDTNVNIVSSTPQSDGSYLVTVTFTSNQNAAQGPHGDTCDNWTLQYKMINVNGAWLINGGNGQNTSC